MAMKILGNMTPGPLYINLSGERTVKIPARGRAEVDEADLDSPELLFHRSRGHIVVLDKPETSQVSSR
jgi:hypothetical protein